MPEETKYISIPLLEQEWRVILGSMVCMSLDVQFFEKKENVALFRLVLARLVDSLKHTDVITTLPDDRKADLRNMGVLKERG